MLRFAANLSMMYQEFALPDRFAAAAADGFRAVEYLFPYDCTVQDLAVWLNTHGLSLALINAPPGDWVTGERGLACIPGQETRFRTTIRTALDYARALDCPRVHVMAGFQPAGITRSALRQTYLSNLRWAAGIAASEGLVLLIEPLNQRDMPGYFISHQQDAHDIVEEIGSPALRVQMDLYHCQIVEGDLSTRLRRYLQAGSKQVGHMQVASVPDRHEPDGGEVDYNYLFALIETLDYDGWIGCEYRPKAGTSAGLTWIRQWINSSGN